MALYLAMDAGGTKTDYLLADEARELARVSGGTLKRMRVDAETAGANLDGALAELARRSGASLGSVARTCVGTAGVTVPLVNGWLGEALTARVGGELVMLGDVEIALDAAFFGGPGVLVMAGTGSNVAGRSRDGAMTTAGGYGPALSDQASGHRIGSEALRDALVAFDEGRETVLLRRMLESWELASVEELVAYVHGAAAPNMSQLAPVVVACAGDGDEVATALLRREGESLAHLAGIVIGRLGVPKVAFAGSILEHVRIVREAVEAALRRKFAEVEFVPEVVDPLLGALWRARAGV